MSTFDTVGGDNMPDAGGGNPLPAPAVGVPSVPNEPAVQPPQTDPRLQAALASLQPRPQPTGLQAVLQKLVPIIGASIAMSKNAGGAFTDSWRAGDLARQQQQDLDAQKTLRLATILHQQEQERQAAAATAARERVAQSRIDAAASKEAADKKTQAERDLWKSLADGDTITHANEIAQSQGKDAADQYLAGFAGLGGSLKDLVDKYSVRDATSGVIASGRVKTPKETTAGSKEEYVIRARDLFAKQLGRPLTDSETQQLDEKSLKRYASFTKDDDQNTILKGLQVDNAKLEKELKQQAIDRGYAEKFGSAPTYFQDAEGKVHGYIYDKTKNRTVEIPVDIPEGVTRIQPPDKFQQFLKDIGLGGTNKPATVVPLGGNGPAPTDPNWGKP